MRLCYNEINERLQETVFSALARILLHQGGGISSNPVIYNKNNE